jgi:hypothetical protein
MHMGIADNFEKFTKAKGGKGKAGKPMPPKKGKKPMPPMKGKLGSAKKMPMPMGGALGSYFG